MTRARMPRPPAEGVDRDQIMDRTRAAVSYVNMRGAGHESDLALAAFMSIFHPEVDPAEIVRDARLRRSRR